MGAVGQAGRTVWRRLEALPAVRARVELQKRTGSALKAAMNAAYSRLDDGAAAAKLRDSLGNDTRGIDESLALLSGRDDYLRDRAYRLLMAAKTGTAVEPVPPQRAELYAEEEALGRMPIEHAFQRLAESEPTLLDVRQQLGTEQPLHKRHPGLPKDTERSLNWLIGSGARGDGALLRTSLGSSIVHHYLKMLADSRLGTPTTPYFDCPRKVVVLTGTLTSGQGHG